MEHPLLAGRRNKPGWCIFPYVYTKVPCATMNVIEFHGQLFCDDECC